MTMRIIGAMLVVATTCPAGLAASKTPAGPLAEYVAKQDDSFNWVKLREGKLGKTSFVESILTSQTWQNIVWKHRLFIIKPSNVAPDAHQGVLIIAGGSWKDAYENASGPLKLPREAALFAFIAEQVKSPVAVLMQVPREPMFGGKVEDAIISLTFEKFLKTGNPEWPLLLPMVKSAVRAMDAVQEYCQKEWSLQLDAFTVTGASKRGWTTWLTGAVDDRATAIAPMVIDMLNMVPQMKHQLDVWGGYSNKIHDYTERGLQKHLGSKSGKALRDIVDPYSYRTALDQPKLIMIGTNDHYWPIDALNLYWKDLAGENYILYVPNNRHGLRDFPRMIGGLKVLHEHVANGKKLPKLAWKFKPGDDRITLQVTSDIKPVRVQAWAASAETRDFRDSPWHARPMQVHGDAYVYELPRPESGSAALFGEAVYPNGGTPFFLSTNVRVISAKEATTTRSEKSATP